MQKIKKHSIWKRSQRSSILTRWTWVRPACKHTRILRLAQKGRCLERQITRRNLSWQQVATKRISLTGRMDLMTSSMRSILNILSILCHLRASLLINRTSLRSNRRNSESTIKCSRPSIRATH